MNIDMIKGIVRVGIIVVILIVLGAVMYTPVSEVVGTIADLDPALTDTINSYTWFFVAAIAFGIIAAIISLFLWSHKYEYERY